MSTLKVDGIRSNSATSDAITLASNGTCIANITNRTNKNLILNGAFQIAQRSTSSSTDTNGYHTVDRFKPSWGNIDNAITQAQVDVASGTTPYTLGFRKALKITNGNQTSGAGANSHIRIMNIIEGQDIANSGWNYLSSSSFITLSFWVKSSVAQNFYGFIRSTDGTMYQYPFETGSLTANTWTKITKTISGNSNLQFDNDNGGAWELYIHQFAGTNETASGVTLNAWATYSGTAKMPDNTSTWYTTNDATFEITGVQLEVGSVATDFEFKSFGQELALCQRYCYVDRGSEDYHVVAQGHFSGSGTAMAMLYLPVCMRAAPTLAYPTGTWIFSADSGTIAQSNIFPQDNIGGVNAIHIRGAVSGAPSGEGFLLRTSSAGHSWILSAEL